LSEPASRAAVKLSPIPAADGHFAVVAGTGAFTAFRSTSQRNS
jgi:hypothetical protein